jgi:hypothetical protein
LRRFILACAMFALLTGAAHGQVAFWCPGYPIDSVYYVGDTVTMCWDSTGIYGTYRMYRIDLSLDSGETFPYCIQDVYQPQVGGEEYYQWEVSSSVRSCADPSMGTSAISEGAAIRILDVDPQYTDDTLVTSVFAIRPALYASPPILLRVSRRPQTVRAPSRVFDISGRSAVARMGAGVAVRVLPDGTVRRVLLPGR